MNKEKPIIFSTESVKTILDGRKTQTRRVIKHTDGTLPQSRESIFYSNVRQKYHVGDILYVKETYHPFCWMDVMKPKKERLTHDIEYKEDYIRNNAGNEFDVKWSSPLFMPRKYARIFLKVTDIRVERLQDISPSEAIREGVNKYDVYEDGRFFAYQDYSQKACNRFQGCVSPVGSYQTLWDSINLAKGFGWNSNPYVWVVEFERI